MKKKKKPTPFYCVETVANNALNRQHIVLENIKRLQLVLADHKLKLAEELKISEGSVFTILHEHLSTRKLCSKWKFTKHFA